MKEINLSNGRICKVDDFGLILEIYIFEAGENEALCCISFNVDDCCKFSFKDNLDYCIDKIREFVTLTEEDEEQIEDLLEIPFYNVSFGTHYLSLLADIRTALEWVWEGGTINYIEKQHHYNKRYFTRHYYDRLYIMDDCELEEMYEIAKKKMKRHQTI